MQWLGKALGAAIGMAFGPWGALFGALLGHQFDQGLAGTVSGSAAEARKRFFATSFEVMGHIAKIDGRVSEQEIQIARRIMHAMHLGPDQVRQAIAHFTAGKAADYPLQQRLDDLVQRIGQRRDLARAFVEIQVQAAVGAGEIAPSKRELLWQLARSFGFNRVELAQIEAMIRARQAGTPQADAQLDSGAAYRTLGIESSATDKEVKTAYRRLMNAHHPDKLVSRGLPESMKDVAEERTQQIRAAYERIKAERGFK